MAVFIILLCIEYVRKKRILLKAMHDTDIHTKLKLDNQLGKNNACKVLSFALKNSALTLVL